MIKKISTFFLILLVSLSSGLWVSADSQGYVRENLGLITENDEVILEETAAAIAQEHDFQTHFVIVDSLEEVTDDYASSLYQEQAGEADGVLLLVDSSRTNWSLYYGGQGQATLGTAGEDILWYAFAKETTWGQGVQSYLAAVKARLQEPARLVDQAGLLTTAEQSSLLAKLNEISERQEVDVVVMTVYSLNGQTVEAFADDAFDFNGYGQGPNHDGILLLISMEARDWHMTTTGFGIYAFSDAGLEFLSQQFLKKLSAGEYAAAFNSYADLADQFLTQAKTGSPYDRGNMPRQALSVIWIPVSLLVGLLVAWIVVTSLKGQLQSVQYTSGADSYLRKGSFQLLQSQDLFLYRNVSKVPKPKSSDSNGFRGGGSSSHGSFSGGSHGGLGGKF